MTITEFQGEYRFLSNFFPSPLNAGGTLEHEYQASKTVDDVEALEISRATSPRQAKRLGQHITLRSDWEHVKLAVMHRLLRKKFADPNLRAKLLATGEEWLVEGNTWGDQYWGVCDGTGENHLGLLLMQVRFELRGGK